MPWCPGIHQARIEQFQAVFIVILEKKARKTGKARKYSPFSSWDFFTDLNYRTVVTTVCMLTFLLSASCVMSVIHNHWITSKIFYLSGGYAEKGLSLNRIFVCGTDIVEKFPNFDKQVILSMLCTMDIPSMQQYCGTPCISRLLLLSGDVEQHPGPSVEELIQNLAERIENRMDIMTGDFRSISTSVSNMADRLQQLTDQLRKKEKELQEVKDRTDILEKKMKDIEQEVERQQIFSRRDNIVFFGIPEKAGNEMHEDCADTIVDLLNKTSDSDRVWCKDDIARAHRLGKSTNRSRPIIIKLQRSRDKHTLITDKHMKSELKKERVSINDDLTKQQRLILKEEREKGFIAYFRGARLFTKPTTRPRSSVSEDTADSDNDTQDEDPPEDRQPTRTPSPRPSTSRPTSTNASSDKWRQFREQSRQRQSVQNGRDSDSSVPSKNSVRSDKRQTRSNNVNTKKTKQNRIDDLLGSGTREVTK